METGRHVLTAAHCLEGGEGGVAYEAKDVTVSFDLPDGEVSIGPMTSGLTVHPDWDPVTKSNDIAVIELSQNAPAGAERYPFYRTFDAVGRNGLKVGYGRPGTGDAGQDPEGQFGEKRFGWNRYDLAVQNQLSYDFDNGQPENDAWGRFEAIADTGLGSFEVSAAHGDSGGPTFVDGRIAAVTSGGVGRPEGVTTDVDSLTNSSFGEIVFDTQVAAYQDWIDEVLGFRVVDNDDSQFSSSGWWATSGLDAYGKDSLYSATGYATYNFDSLKPGWYQVMVNTPAHSNSTNRAVYTLATGGQSIITTADQRPGTDGWRLLDTIQITGNALQVKVSQGGEGYLRTDAVRVQAVDQPAYQTPDDTDAALTGWWGKSGLPAYREWDASTSAVDTQRSQFTTTGSAAYNFDEVTTGWYRVLVNTPGHSKSTDSAVYTMKGGAAPVVTTIDQRPGTNGWRELGIVEVTGNTLDVLIKRGSKTGYLRTDAVRVERLTAPFEVRPAESQPLPTVEAGRWVDRCPAANGRAFANLADHQGPAIAVSQHGSTTAQPSRHNTNSIRELKRLDQFFSSLESIEIARSSLEGSASAGFRDHVEHAWLFGGLLVDLEPLLAGLVELA